MLAVGYFGGVHGLPCAMARAVQGKRTLLRFPIKRNHPHAWFLYLISGVTVWYREHEELEEM
eukprot:176071-Rhodomonas_salina.2